MDERNLIRRAGSDVPKRDREAKERARASLRAEMGTDLAPSGGRRLGRPVAAWLAAAASIVLVLVLAQALRPGQQVAPPATELDRLARLASLDTALNLSADQYLYTSAESLERSSHSVGTDLSFLLLIRERIEMWTREDGAGRRVTTIFNVRFASDEDRAAWVAAGRPDLPKAEDVMIQRFNPGDLTNISGLPTDPVQLRAVLDTGELLGLSPGDDNLALEIGDQLFAHQEPDPKLRAALFEILAGLPPVRTLGPILDPLGREGIGFAVPEGTNNERQFLFDPDTARFLTAVTLHSDGLEPSWEARTITAVVDRLKERPAAA